jgi:formate-dependent nitrite reductase membrane component NrfD
MLEAHLVWGWQPALYLFFGGLSAGTFVCAAALFFFTKDRYKKTINIAVWVAFACLAGGLLLLLSELTQPLRGLLVWQSFSNFSSWMAIGAWIVLIAVIIYAVTAILRTKLFVNLLSKFLKFLPRILGPVSNILFALGALLGLCVAIYTGVLLMSAPGIPFWNTLLLPCLFTVSALGTGIALVEIIFTLVEDGKKPQPVEDEEAQPVDAEEAHKNLHKVRRALELAAIVLVVAETAVLFIFLNSMFAGGSIGYAINSYSQEFAAYTSAQNLTGGALAPYFWGLIAGCALGIPFLAAVVGLFIKGKMGKGVVLVGSISALVGGCSLRFLVLLSALHADFVSDTVFKLLS